MKNGLNVLLFYVISCLLSCFFIPWCTISLLTALIDLKQHNDRSNIQLYQVLTKNYSTSPWVPIDTWRGQEGILGFGSSTIKF